MRTLIRCLTPLILLAGILHCSSDKTNQPRSSTTGFLEHLDYGCAAIRSAAELPSGAAYLMDYTIQGDTLVLQIHFEANCCPKFREDLDISSEEIKIVVTDDRYGCHCICPYENKFVLLWPYTGLVRLCFTSRYTEGIVSAFDTLVTIEP